MQTVADRPEAPTAIRTDLGAIFVSLELSRSIASDLTYDLRSGDPDFIDKLVALTFSNMAYDAILAGKSGLMSAMVEGCYDLAPLPDPKLGPRKVDIATMYNTERYRPIYTNKRGLPIFLSRASLGQGLATCARWHTGNQDWSAPQHLPAAQLSEAISSLLGNPEELRSLGHTSDRD